jgi:hypothetical protein
MFTYVYPEGQSMIDVHAFQLVTGLYGEQPPANPLYQSSSFKVGSASYLATHQLNPGMSTHLLPAVYQLFTSR